MDLVLLRGAAKGVPRLVAAGLAAKPAAHDLTVAWILARRGADSSIVSMLQRAGAQPPPVLTAAQLRRFTGQFGDADLRELQVAQRDGKLVATGAQPGFEMLLGEKNFEEEVVPLDGRTLFFANDFSRRLHFEGDDFERVTVKSFSGAFTLQRTKGSGR
jgi:hypothetical protein